MVGYREALRTAAAGSACCLLLALTAPPSQAQQLLAANDLAGMSLEQLMNIRITSVSRREESLSGAPASLYVITAEDIRRSGATTLPEILRQAPNLQVARVNAYDYAITARGFNNAIGNKLLVLMDGRTIYTPLFSGVFWEMHDAVLADIERIEVISGPGATLWGANAVNGVINIITRHSAETQGLLMSGDAGNYQRGLTLRAGAARGDALSWRAYGKTRRLDNTYRLDGSAARDEWRMHQAGFRADWEGEGQRLTLQGDAFRGESEHRGFAGALEIRPVEVKGGNLLARWTRRLEGGGELQVQGYLNYADREEMILFSPRSEISDLEFQHNFELGAHQVVWGGGARHASDDIEPGAFTIYIPSHRSLNWENLFVQDDFSLADGLDLTLGLKLEWNDYTGLETLPTARLAWRLADDHLLWSSLSRAVRAPSRFDRDVFFPEAPPFIIAGGPDFESEVAVVSELGYRGRPLEALNLSLTLYHHDWDKLRSGTPLPLPAYLANNIEGEVYGLEAWANWELTPRWRLRAGLSTLEKDLRFGPGTSDTVGTANDTLHNDPDFQWQLRSSMDLPLDLQLDLQLRRVDRLNVEPVPAYTELDLWLAWHPREGLELSLSGANLLHGRHAEFGRLANRQEIPRSVLFGVRWQP